MNDEELRVGSILLQELIRSMPSLGDDPIWGLVTRFNKETKQVDTAVVTNYGFFHPKAVIGQGLTYSEAKALEKIFKLGEGNGNS